MRNGGGMSDQSVASGGIAVLGAPELLNLSDLERRIADSLMRCISRWGMAKTTIEDIAHEAGVSAPPSMGSFPVGKSSILFVAVSADVHNLLELLATELAGLDDLESCLVVALHQSARFLDEHPVLKYMRENESAQLEQILGFEKLDAAFVICGQAMIPMLSRFLSPSRAFEAGMWGARILVSYMSEEPFHIDLRNLDDARRVVCTFMIPGLAADVDHDLVDHDLADQDLADQDLVGQDRQDLVSHDPPG